MRLDGVGPEIPCCAPFAGQHTIEVLREIGLDEAEIHVLGRRGVAAWHGREIEPARVVASGIDRENASA